MPIVCVILIPSVRSQLCHQCAQVYQIGAEFPVFPRPPIHRHRLGPKKRNAGPKIIFHALLNAHTWHILGECVDVRLDVPAVGI